MMRSPALARLLVVAVVGLVLPLAAQQKPPGTASAQKPASAEAQLQAAVTAETVAGDLKSAIEAYRRIVANYRTSDPAVAARALLRMGLCYEKLGDAEARKAYEQLIRDFAGQKDAAEQARARLAALATNATSPGVPLPSAPGALRRMYRAALPRAVFTDARVSADGRYLTYFSHQFQQFGVIDLATSKDTRVPFAPEAAVGAKWCAAAGCDGAWVVGVALSPDRAHIAYAVATGGALLPTVSRSQLRVTRVDGTGDRLVASADGALLAPVRWTDDGKGILAAREAGKLLAVVSIRLADGQTEALTSPQKIGTCPAPLPSMSWVSPDARSAAVLDLCEGITLSVVDLRSGVQTVLSSGPMTEAVGDYLGPVWTADSTGLVFQSSRPGKPGIWLVRVVNGAAASAPVMLRDDLGDTAPLAVAADGSFYYSKTAEVQRRFVTRLDPATGNITGSPEPFPELRQSCGQGWSPDGAAIAYGARIDRGAGDEADSMGPSPCTVIAIRSMVDGRERILSPGFTEVRRPRWSPDGKRLAVFGRKDGTFGVYLVDLQGEATRLVIEFKAPQIVGDMIPSPEWTSDGKGLLIGRIDGGHPSRTHRIVSHDLQTGVETERYSLTSPGNVFFTATSVSKDGSVALMVDDKDGYRTAVVLPADGGEARTVFRAPRATRFSWLAWAADARSLVAPRLAPTAADSHNRQLVRLPLAGGDPVPMGLEVAGLDATMPSPDGTRMLYLTWEDVVDLWAVDRLVPARDLGAAAKK